jgi:hypothetical protein
MLDRKYFDNVLPDQLRLMEIPARLTVHVTNGEEYEVRAVGAHDNYVVLTVYGKEKGPKHSKPWRAANPNYDAVIFDQVCIPYASIALAHLTARATKGDDSRTLIGFQKG